MNKYFVSDKGNGNYFSDSITSSAPVKLPAETLSRQPSMEARSVLEKVICNYGIKRAGVVQRRYGIK